MILANERMGWVVTVTMLVTVSMTGHNCDDGADHNMSTSRHNQAETHHGSRHSDPGPDIEGSAESESEVNTEEPESLTSIDPGPILIVYTGDSEGLDEAEYTREVLRYELNSGEAGVGITEDTEFEIMELRDSNSTSSAELDPGVVFCISHFWGAFLNYGLFLNSTCKRLPY